VAALLEAAKSRRLLDQRAAFGRLRRKNLLDAPLSDDGVELGAEPDLGEQLDHVEPAYPSAVDQVLAFPAAVEATHDRKLREVDRPFSVLVVEEELDLGVAGSRAARDAGKEHVVRLLRSKVARAQAAGGPDDRVGDVRLSRAVRADDDGHPGLEPDLDRIRERLEAAQANRAQVHAARV
jgi:hypothetical protein